MTRQPARDGWDNLELNLKPAMQKLAKICEERVFTVLGKALCRFIQYLSHF
jgi:hypothetical protein